MTAALSHLRAQNAAIQNAVNFTLLMLTLILAMYFGAVSLEHAEMVKAV